jgi:large repetitive protein
MKAYSFILLLILSMTNIYSQTGEDRNWVFGNNCGINFNTNPPTNFVSRTMSYEISTSISDSTGNLLAYLSLPSYPSDSSTIKNSDNQIILDGEGINTWSTFAGGASFIQNPLNSNQYYLIYVATENPSLINLYYSLIDMSLENGHGAVIEKNVLLFDGHIGEGIAMTKHANGEDWWILAREIHKTSDDLICTNRFIKFLLTPNGFDGPFFQNIGTLDCFSEWYPSGWLKFSPNGERIAFGLSSQSQSFAHFNILDLFRFNRCNGEIYDPISYIPNAFSIRPYGLEFSPNNDFLYVTTVHPIPNKPNALYQIDLSTTANSSSLTSIWQNDNPEYLAAQLKLAPDGKIYMAYSIAVGGTGIVLRDSLTTNISYISSPNLSGQLCDFKPFYFYLGDSCVCRLDLPNIPNYNLGKISNDDCWTGINEDVENVIKIFPNPTHNIITIEGIKAETIFKIYNIYGKEVISVEIDKGTSSIELKNLKDGIYFYSIPEESLFGRILVVK